MRTLQTKTSQCFFLACAVLVCVLALSVSRALAGPQKAPDRVKAIMIGDRIVDIAYNLGVVPAAMSVRCSKWPMCKQLNNAVQVLGCPKCVLKKKAVPILDAAREKDINRIIVEKHPEFCKYMDISPLELVPFIEDQGFDIEYVDFSKGLESAVQQTAELLDRKSKGTSLINEYNMKMERTKEKIKDLDRSRKVLIINGIYQRKTGRVMLQVEAPGGYADQFLLDPLECENVGGAFQVGDKEPAKGHYRVPKSRKGLVLDSLVDANPDIIVMTGNAFAVQKAISSARKYTKGLDRVSAIQNNRLYALPGYIDASVIEYPMILRMWADAMDG